MFVHLCFKYAEFVKLRLVCHAKSSVTVGTIGEPCPEIRKLIDYRCKVTDGCTEISCFLMQERTVENRHEILWLHLDDEVKVGDSSVIVSQLYTHQTTVVVCEKIIRIQIQCIVVIAHSSPQIVEVDTSQGSIDIVVYIVWLEMQRLGESLIGNVPFFSCESHVGTCGPCISIVWIELQTFIQPFFGTYGIFFLEIHFCLEGICIGKVMPLLDDRIKLYQSRIVFLVLHQTERTVEPIVAISRFNLDGRIVILDSLIIFALSDTANST